MSSQAGIPTPEAGRLPTRQHHQPARKLLASPRGRRRGPGRAAPGRLGPGGRGRGEGPREPATARAPTRLPGKVGPPGEQGRGIPGPPGRARRGRSGPRAPSPRLTQPGAGAPRRAPHEARQRPFPRPRARGGRRAPRQGSRERDAGTPTPGPGAGHPAPAALLRPPGPALTVPSRPAPGVRARPAPLSSRGSHRRSRTTAAGAAAPRARQSATRGGSRARKRPERR